MTKDIEVKEIEITATTTIRDLNIEEAVKAKLVEERKDLIIATVKELQSSIAASNRATEKLEDRLQEVLNIKVEDLMSDPNWKKQLRISYSGMDLR